MIRWSRIWLPTAALFVLLCILAWLNEILDLPHVLLEAPRTPINWREAILETGLVIAVALIVMSRLISGAPRLEEKQSSWSAWRRPSSAWSPPSSRLQRW